MIYDVDTVGSFPLDPKLLYSLDWEIEWSVCEKKHLCKALTHNPEAEFRYDRDIEIVYDFNTNSLYFNGKDITYYFKADDLKWFYREFVYSGFQNDEARLYDQLARKL